MRNVAVVGGGIVGVTASLLAARRGWRVTLFEAEQALWTRASAANEGKVHLGPVFALGDRATAEVLQEGALSFADVLEEAYGSPLPWPDLVSDVFDYLVMPDSLLTADELSRRYAEMNERLAGRDGNYLGEALAYVADPTVRLDHHTGLPAFRTTERAVEPVLLGRLLCDRVWAHPSITVHTGCRASSVRRRDAGGGVVVSARGPGAELIEDRYDAVINAAWEGQQSLVPPTERVSRNFRLKCAVRLTRPAGPCPTVTLVQGPFGDVVPHRDYVYASWYPAGRLSNEHGTTPSLEAHQALASVAGRVDLVESQLQPLRDLGLLPATTDGSSATVVGGFIAGHGTLDIDVRTSELHRRAEFGPRRVGGMVVATNYKLTTAPLAARLAVDEVARGELAA